MVLFTLNENIRNSIHLRSQANPNTGANTEGWRRAYKLPREHKTGLPSSVTRFGAFLITWCTSFISGMRQSGRSAHITRTSRHAAGPEVTRIVDSNLTSSIDLTNNGSRTSLEGVYCRRSLLEEYTYSVPRNINFSMCWMARWIQATTVRSSDPGLRHNRY